VAFVAHFANGNRRARAVGNATVAAHPNFSRLAAAQLGTHLTQKANVQAASITGNIQFVCRVVVGQSMKIGTSKESSIDE
jgi:hypothetical protein